MTNLSVNRHAVNDSTARLAVAGEVDITACDLLEQTILNSLTADHIAKLVVDLNKVTFLDSSGARGCCPARDRYRPIRVRADTSRALPG